MKLKYTFYIICLMLTCFAFFLQISPEVATPFLSMFMDIPTLKVVDYTSLFLISYGLMQIPNGIVLDKYGIKVFPLYALLVVTGLAIFWVSPNKTTLILREIFTGIGSSIAFIAAVYIATQAFGMRYRALFIALASVFGSLGAILSTSAYESLITHTSWSQSIFCLLIFAILILIVSVAILLKMKVKKPGNINYNLKQNLKAVLKNKLILSVYAYTFFTWMVMMSFAGYWDKIYFETVHHLSIYKALDITQIYWVSYMVFSVLMSFLVKSKKDCFKLIKVLAITNILALTVLALPILYSTHAIFILALLCGASTAGITLGFSIITMTVSYKELGLTASINNCILVLGGFLGQILYGFIMQHLPEQSLNVLDHTILIENYYFALFLLPAAAIIACIFIYRGINKAAPTTLQHYKP